MALANLYEVIGYAGSVFVAISLTMRSLLWLRVINLVGCVFFVVYGVAIGAWPVAGLNMFIVLVNLYYLLQHRSMTATANA